jgi:transposase
MERRQFTDEFKREAVRLASQPGISKAGISKDLGINANMLHRWVREQEGNPSKIARSKDDVVSSVEFERLRRELARVRTERDILKKARSPTSLSTPSEVWFYRPSPLRMAYTHDVPGFGGICQWFLRLVRTGAK